MDLITIRQATVDDLPNCGACAGEFYASAPSLGKFYLDQFCNVWTTLLGNGSGVMFLLLNDEEVVGSIGGITHKELYCDETVAAEMFWHVSKAYRGIGGLRLFKMFEQWAVQKGCDRIRMAYLSESMPDKLANFYKRQDYFPLETYFCKVLKEGATA